MIELIFLFLISITLSVVFIVICVLVYIYFFMAECDSDGEEYMRSYDESHEKVQSWHNKCHENNKTFGKGKF